jgi:hypothetical protein
MHAKEATKIDLSQQTFWTYTPQGLYSSIGQCNDLRELSFLMMALSA